MKLARRLGIRHARPGEDGPRWPAVTQSGHARLDASLPDGGWKAGQLVEVFTPCAGEAEWSLLAPLVSALAAQGRPVGMMNAPRALKALTLAAPGHGEVSLAVAPQLHAVEAALHWLDSHAQGALVLWLTEVPAASWRELRRSARRSDAIVFVVRPSLARWDESPADLRITLAGTHPGPRQALEVQVQSRACPAATTIRLTMPPGPAGCTPPAQASTRPLKILRDQQDARRTVMSGTMAEVCRELDRLARLEA